MEMCLDVIWQNEYAFRNQRRILPLFSWYNSTPKNVDLCYLTYIFYDYVQRAPSNEERIVEYVFEKVLKKVLFLRFVFVLGGLPYFESV